MTRDMILDCFAAFGITFIAATALCIIRLTLRGKKAAKVGTKAFQNGYSDDVIAYYEKQARRSRNSEVKLESTLMLASCYAEALRYDEAFEALAKVELADITHDALRAAYFNTAVYIYLMAGDFASAERLYICGKALLDKYASGKYGSEFGAEISHTIAAMEFARGNIYQAELMLGEIKNMVHSDKVSSACDIYLIMIYLATDRLEEAKATAEAAFPFVSCYRDKQTMLRLMRCIEGAYGINSNNCTTERE